jgi:hypothetical protein
MKSGMIPKKERRCETKTYGQMRNKVLCFLLSVILGACATGKKAFDRGDYFGAVRTAVEKLRSHPDHKKSLQVVENSYPLALKWAQDEIDLLLSGNQPLKWDQTIRVMQQVNELASLIRKSPAALRIIPEPKKYITELTMASEKAAEETYNSGLMLIGKNTRESAREAYRMFLRANELVPGYRDCTSLIPEAKMKGSLHVVVEPIPVHSALFQLSSLFFYDQFFEYLHKNYPETGFVLFYSPSGFEQSGMDNPDMVMNLEFFDFVVGNQVHSESEKELSKTVKVNPKDTLNNETVTYKAKLKTIEDRVASGGVVELKIVSYPAKKLLLADRIPGEFGWINRYGIYVGDKEALSNEQLEMTRNKVQMPPPAQTMFVEFTKPIFQQLVSRVNSFFRDYK